MSVISWSVEDFGNLAAYLVPGHSDYARHQRRLTAEDLATISQANVEEFMSTYASRHGTPEPVTADQILGAAPNLGHPGRAASMLKLLAYNAHGSEEGRLRTQTALACVLTQAVCRLAGE